MICLGWLPVGLGAGAAAALWVMWFAVRADRRAQREQIREHLRGHLADSLIDRIMEKVN